MKAGLVMDMPEDCYQCLFGHNEYFSGKFICAATDDWDAIKEDYFHDKPDWCPLRPLPEKRNTTNFIEMMREAEENHVASQHQAGFNRGWNACLDAITGEVEV